MRATQLAGLLDMADAPETLLLRERLTAAGPDVDIVFTKIEEAAYRATAAQVNAMRALGDPCSAGCTTAAAREHTGSLNGINRSQHPRHLRPAQHRSRHPCSRRTRARAADATDRPQLTEESALRWTT